MKELKINIDNNLKKNSKIVSKEEYRDIVKNFKKYVTHPNTTFRSSTL